jgi:gas vesicle protein
MSARADAKTDEPGPAKIWVPFDDIERTIKTAKNQNLSEADQKKLEWLEKFLLALKKLLPEAQKNIKKIKEEIKKAGPQTQIKATIQRDKMRLSLYQRTTFCRACGNEDHAVPRNGGGAGV